MTTNVTTGEAPSFFQQYFIDPIIQRTGYNPINTITYGIILVLGAYLLFKFFKKLGYKIDMRFFKANLPFILLVSVWRALTDAGVYPYGFLTTTPGLYLPVLLLFFPLIILAKKLEDAKVIKKYEYIYTVVSTALLISQLIIFITLIPTNFVSGAALTVFYFMIISSAPILILSKYWKPLKNKYNLLMILSHFIDASATHVSITYYNYFEQHVIPEFIFNTFGSIAFYPWKLIVLGVVIYFLDKEKGNKELTNFIKMIFITFGIAIGLRNFLRLTMGV